MSYEVVDENGKTIPQSRQPECSRDFCDACGDCLACYGAEYVCLSRDSRVHIWVIEDENKAS